MSSSVENDRAGQFAEGESGRSLRADLNGPGPDTSLELEGPPLDGDSEDPHADSREDSNSGLKALKQDSVGDRDRRIDLAEGSEREGASGGRPRFKRTPRRLLLVALLIVVGAAITPFVWNYLQSYESTDDAQIDGHIDPLSSRIDGTVIRVHVEDDDRVRKGELLVEIDPRDYEVAAEVARAQLELAVAQVASAKQDYAAAMAKIREDEAANFRAQRDARRYATLLAEQVVPQEQYDQYIATARVDAATVDSTRQAAGSALKTITARQAYADAAKAALDQALLNLSYTRIYAPANGIVGKRAVQLGSRIQPGQTLMFVTETDQIWVTADFKETQLARMHRGEKVTIYVDTFGRDYRGYVVNMPGASGDRFSLLPSENATGNYVKVVQRLPVRILFERGEDPDHLLHPGMSVEPTVWLR